MDSRADWRLRGPIAHPIVDNRISVTRSRHTCDHIIRREDTFVNSMRKEVSVPYRCFISIVVPFYDTLSHLMLFLCISSIPEDVQLWSPESYTSFLLLRTWPFVHTCSDRDRITATICRATQLSGMNFFNFIAGPGNRVLREEFCGKSPAGFPIPDSEMRLLSRLLVRRERTGGAGERQKERELASPSVAKLRWFKGASSYVLWAPRKVKDTGDEGWKFDSKSKIPRSLNRDFASYRRESAANISIRRIFDEGTDGKEARQEEEGSWYSMERPT